MTQQLQIPTIGQPQAWQLRTNSDPVGRAFADRHYSRRSIGAKTIGPPGRRILLVLGDESAVWMSHWPRADLTLDDMDAWRCSMFRNEGNHLSSELIRSAMATTATIWGTPPPDGWLTFVDTRKVSSQNPGYCFKQAGWYLDRDWTHRHLVRLRATATDHDA